MERLSGDEYDAVGNKVISSSSHPIWVRNMRKWGLRRPVSVVGVVFGKVLEVVMGIGKSRIDDDGEAVRDGGEALLVEAMAMVSVQLSS